MNTPNPNCPGVPHRPDDPLYRAAVLAHIKLGGSIQQRPIERDHWSMPYTPYAGALTWGIDEYRPAEPLRTDARPEGLHDPGNEWHWVLKGEAVEPGDKEYAPISDVWVTLESPSVNDGSRIVRRRLTPEQAKSDTWEGIIEEVHELNESVEADRIRDMMDSAIEEHRNGETEDWPKDDEYQWVPADQAFRELSEASGGRWDGVNPEEYVNELRGRNADKKYSRMEALVKRLSEYNPPLLDSEQYEVYQIIQEAKELADHD